MPKATITAKGQVTVPQEIRDALGVSTGHELLFRVTSQGTVVVEAVTLDLRSLAGMLHLPLRRARLEELNEAIRKNGWDAR